MHWNNYSHDYVVKWDVSRHGMSLFGGLEWTTGLLEWTTGILEWITGMATYLTRCSLGGKAQTVTWFCNYSDEILIQQCVFYHCNVRSYLAFKLKVGRGSE